MSSIPSTLRLEDEDDLILWNETSETTAVTYTYCSSLTPSYGLLTAVNPSTVSLDHSGDFTVFADKFVYFDYQWYYIPETPTISKDDYTSDASIIITNAQMVKCSRECWDESRTKIARNKVIMMETTSADGCYFDIPTNGTYTIHYANEVAGKDGAVALLSESTELAEYDYALPIDFEWLEESYVKVDSGIYYIPEDCTITVTTETSYKRVQFANTKLIAASSINDAPFTVRELTTKEDYRYLFGGEDGLKANTTQTKTLYDGIDVSDAGVMSGTGESTFSYVVNGEDVSTTAGKLRGKYFLCVEDGNFKHIPSDATFAANTVTHANTYKLIEANDGTTITHNNTTFHDSTVRISYWDSITLDTATGKITGSGGHTLTISNEGTDVLSVYPAIVASNYDVLIGKYGYANGWSVSNYNTYTGWIKFYQARAFNRYANVTDTSTTYYVQEFIYFTKEYAAPDATETYYTCEVQCNPMQVNKELQHTAYIRSVGGYPYISTDVFRASEAASGSSTSTVILPDGSGLYDDDGNFLVEKAYEYLYSLDGDQFNEFLSGLSEEELEAFVNYVDSL